MPKYKELLQSTLSADVSRLKMISDIFISVFNNKNVNPFIETCQEVNVDSPMQNRYICENNMFYIFKKLSEYYDSVTYEETKKTLNESVTTEIIEQNLDEKYNFSTENCFFGKHTKKCLDSMILIKKNEFAIKLVLQQNNNTAETFLDPRLEIVKQKTILKDFNDFLIQFCEFKKNTENDRVFEKLLIKYSRECGHLEKNLATFIKLRYLEIVQTMERSTSTLMDRDLLKQFSLSQSSSPTKTTSIKRSKIESSDSGCNSKDTDDSSDSSIEIFSDIRKQQHQSSHSTSSTPSNKITNDNNINNNANTKKRKLSTINKEKNKNESVSDENCVFCLISNATHKIISARCNCEVYGHLECWVYHFV